MALAKLGARKRHSATRRLSLPGAGVLDLDRFVEAFVAGSGLDSRIARRIAGIYGARANRVAELSVSDESMREVVDESSGLTVAEIAFALKEEFAGSLTDILARRTMVGIGPTLPDEAVDRAAQVASRIAGWDDERVEWELRTFRSRLNRFRIPRHVDNTVRTGRTGCGA